jgi:DnaJ-class molecular chaperone
VQDYYKVLGLGREASTEEIKKSFRVMALRYHPDKNSNSEESKEKFMHVVEAFEVLSDEGARRKYDESFLSKHRNDKFNLTWSPSADFKNIYSYANIKNSSGQGGIWNISQEASMGMWKATVILFTSLGVMALLIFLLK